MDNGEFNSGTTRILVVEDEKPMARAMTTKLRKCGYEVEMAHDGHEGLEKVKQSPFDVILLDVMMPYMDGFAFLEELNKMDLNARIFVLSNLSQEEDRRKARELGAEKFLVKSDISINEVIEYINSVT